MKLGFIGLGKMGSRMVEKLLREGHEVVVWNRSKEPIEELKLKMKMKNLKMAKTVKELILGLKRPRVVWSMLPAGEPTESMLLEIGRFAEKDDIVIDGGNAYYKDTQKRYEEFRRKGINFLGIGVSGGIVAAKEGYPIMVGGSKKAFSYILPILKSLAKPNGGYEYFGEGGAGHFVKMIHNAIEYGIMQSLGEGFDVLENAPYKLDLVKVGKLWQRGTLISGFMLDRAVEVLANDPHLSEILGYIEESGEARWAVRQAKEEKVPIEIIGRSLNYRRLSQKDKKIQKSFTAKMVAALRRQFGGHAVKKRR